MSAGGASRRRFTPRAWFGFRAAADRTVSALGGGQQVRAALACRLGDAAPPQFLILDEPTNHLDPEATEALEAGPCGYDGALLVVSHDEAFLVLSHDEAFLETLRITRRVCLGGPAGCSGGEMVRRT